MRRRLCRAKSMQRPYSREKDASLTKGEAGRKEYRNREKGRKEVMFVGCSFVIPLGKESRFLCISFSLYDVFLSADNILACPRHTSRLQSTLLFAKQKERLIEYLAKRVPSRVHCSGRMPWHTLFFSRLEGRLIFYCFTHCSIPLMLGWLRNFDNILASFLGFIFGSKYVKLRFIFGEQKPKKNVAWLKNRLKYRVFPENCDTTKTSSLAYFIS